MLTASHLTRRFGERVAVDDVSFELAPGEVFALFDRDSILTHRE